MPPKPQITTSMNPIYGCSTMAVVLVDIRTRVVIPDLDQLSLVFKSIADLADASRRSRCRGPAAVRVN